VTTTTINIVDPEHVDRYREAVRKLDEHVETMLQVLGKCVERYLELVESPSLANMPEERRAWAIKALAAREPVLVWSALELVARQLRNRQLRRGLEAIEEAERANHS
jgi:hypothetical protein